MERRVYFFEKLRFAAGLSQTPEETPKETPERAAAELVRETQDANVVRARAMADAHHFNWPKEHMLTSPDHAPFDVLDPIRSYAQLFNRTAFPAGRESRIEHVLAEARRDVQVIPGIEQGTRRWKLQCLAVSTDWMDPHLDVAFPRLGEAIRLINQLVGKRGVAFTDVQLVTFTEWRRPQKQGYSMEDRIEALADKLGRVGVTFEVLTWDCKRFDWSPDLNEIGQPLLRHGTRPCHWRLDRWSEA